MKRYEDMTVCKTKETFPEWIDRDELSGMPPSLLYGSCAKLCSRESQCIYCIHLIEDTFYELEGNCYIWLKGVNVDCEAIDQLLANAYSPPDDVTSILMRRDEYDRISQP